MKAEIISYLEMVYPNRLHIFNSIPNNRFEEVTKLCSADVDYCFEYIADTTIESIDSGEIKINSDQEFINMFFDNLRGYILDTNSGY